MSSGGLSDVLPDLVISPSDIEYEKVIGRGAFGEVWKGIIKSSKKFVAIKKLYYDQEQEKVLDLFTREIETHAKILHPNLLPLIGYTTAHPFCILTKYIPNGSLSDAIHLNSLGKKLTPTQLTILAHGTAAGMSYLHRNRIIHRDLKPDNILLDENLFPVIGDFGSSKRKLDIQQTMTGHGGTPCYMAPEFLSAKSYDEKIDVYSYGVTLWEMMTGERPFEGCQGPQILCLVIIQHQRPKMPEDVNPRIKDLIERCWHSDPKIRPSFDEILNLFETGLAFPGTSKSEFQAYLSAEKPQDRVLAPNISLPSQSLKKPMIPRLHVGQMAQAYLAALETGTSLQKTQAIQFFSSHKSDIALASVGIWKPLLDFALTADESQHEALSDLLVGLAQTQEILSTISGIPNLFLYVRPFTLDLFLYIINFVPLAVDGRLVSVLETFSFDYSVSQKAISLLFKIAQTDEFKIGADVIGFFITNVANFVSNPDGHLIVRMLALKHRLLPDVVTIFASSAIDENAIAAYHALFSCGMPGHVVPLASVLRHIRSPNARLRSAALEFILRHGFEADNDTIVMVIEAIVFAVSNFGSEPGVLLLCRYADTERTSLFLLLNQIAIVWMSPENAQISQFLRVFAVLARSPIPRPFLADLPYTVPFVSALMKVEPASVLRVIDQFDLTDDLLGRFARDPEFCDSLQSYVLATLDFENALPLLEPLAKSVNFGRLDEMMKVIAGLIKASAPGESVYLKALEALCSSRESFNEFIEANIVGAVSTSNLNGAKTTMLKIFDNYAKLGLSIPGLL